MPAAGLGLHLLRIAGAPASAQALQIVAATIATAVFLALVRTHRECPARVTRWAPVALASTLFFPLLTAPTGGPERWLVFAGIRLYVAPIVLPLLLLLLDATARAPAAHAAAVLAATTALALQPDAAQLTAFACGTLVLLAASPSAARSLRAALAATVLCGAAIAWRLPDPLAPVRHVEGVFVVASETSRLLLIAALASAALPLLALVRTASVTRSIGPCAVAAYYACLFALAPLQVTPVPILGFGAGPILGYALVAAAIARRSARVAA